MRARIALTLALVALLATGAAADTEAEVRALGRALHDPDFDRAVAAAARLRALGEEARPALRQLVRALDRRLPEDIARLRWHRWHGLTPRYERDIVAAIEAIGPDARAAIPGLLRIVAGGRGGAIDWLIRPLFEHWRADKTARAGLLRWAERSGMRVESALKDRIKAWLVTLGAEAHPVWDAWLTDKRGDLDLAVRTLHDAGDAGMPILRRHFGESHLVETKLLTTWLDAGHLPPFAYEAAATRLGADTLSHRTDALVDRLAKLDVDLAPRVAEKLGSLHFHRDPWRALTKHGGAFGRRVGQHWFAAHGPPPDDAGFDDDGRRRTRALGGPGGEAFVETPGRLLVGLRYTTGTVNWRRVIRSVQGIYWKDGKLSDGAVFGRPGAERGTVMSQPGYVLGGLYAQHSDRFESFAVVYMRLRDGRLDPKDAYIDTWHGGEITGHEETLIGGQGHPIVGLHGRGGADIDALGLVEQRAP